MELTQEQKADQIRALENILAHIPDEVGSHDKWVLEYLIREMKEQYGL